MDRNGIVITALALALLGLGGCSERGSDAVSGDSAAPAAEAPAAAAPAAAPAESAPTRPNVLVIVADDLAYTDLGVYGGEIATPNLDALAKAGILFTAFHTAPTCSPTRAMLLSGVDHHIAGIGSMAEELAPNQRGQPGYEGYLNQRVAALSELLRDGGYNTYMTGKWHLGLTEETSPAARGFERSFVLLQGGGGHFDDLGLVKQGPKALYREDGKSATLPADFYSTRFYAERMIDYLKGGETDGKPFFAYLAFSAPHWPLQAPAESVARYKGRYDAGYDVLHAERLARMKELGLVAADAQVYPRHAGEPAWEDLSAEHKRVASKLMEIYAAMVDDLDREVGRVVEYLKASGQFENTIIFFMSDNGAEGHHLTKSWPDLEEWVKDCCDNSYDNMGRGNSYLWYGPNWGWAGAAPWRMFKGFTYEGGITVPAFASWPARYPGARVSKAFASVLDITPTVLELAGVAHPGTEYQGRPIAPLQGRSLVPLLAGADAVHPADHVMGWELFGKRALRQGDWKIVWAPPPEGKGDWELFNTAVDPSEVNDLAKSEPARLQQLLAHWDEYVRAHGVILPDEVSGY